MLRLRLDQAHLKRTIRPLYTWTQATPKGQYLDPEWDRSVPIFPGMVAMRAGGDLVTLIDGTGVPQGLFGHFIGGWDIDEVRDQGVNAVAVWVLSPDAEMEVDAPAFDDELTWTDPVNGTELLVHAQTTGPNRGKLVPAGTANASAAPVARLLKVLSDTTIVVGGLAVRDYS
jgi:hypothetical protein